MQAEALIKLIEEMIEIKVRQQAGANAAINSKLPPELAQLIARTKVADRDRILRVRSELLQLLGNGTGGFAS
ncbi:hypothetical protein [Pedosphaera parvula]|uniref:Uncharacterized protein n=1 Tax=Pedosphaera parvula (strain Ellin514) TaxID=320771 RepID=B9XKT3_PEDPL|nr:hypothetical protein [Pedosphaera parvula]EEF59576.1 hypothetical protein Cflav_PD2483 [Pedosphaera parvula Ellin514]